MIQNQIRKRLMQNQIFSNRKGRFPIYNAEMQSTNHGNQLSNEKVGEGELSETSSEQYNIRVQSEFNSLTPEQKSRQADLHEHPYERENSPWRRQRTQGLS